MARLPRLRLPGYTLHVVVRGNNRQPIFVTEGDRLFLHRTLGEAARSFGVQVHAYVFMPNHLHLLVTGEQADSVSKTIQSLGRRYVSYFNFLHRRTGTLWEGRFYSTVVDTRRYFFVCQRYVEMNPVRAGLCSHPSDFAWSSYRRYAEGKADDIVIPHSMHREHGCDEPAVYRRLVEEDITPETLAAIRDATHHGWVLGDKDFCDQVAKEAGRRSMRISRAGRPEKRQLIEMESDPINQISLRLSR